MRTTIARTPFFFKHGALAKKGVRAIVVLMHQGDTVDLGQVNDCLNPIGPLADIIGRSSNEVDLYLTGHTPPGLQLRDRRQARHERIVVRPVS